MAEAAELFHTSDSIAYADVEVNEHRETWALRSPSFRSWVTRHVYEETGGAVDSKAMQTALGVLEAKAKHAGPERAVFARTGEMRGRIYLDLANEHWQAVEVDSTGWRVVDRLCASAAPRA